MMRIVKNYCGIIIFWIFCGVIASQLATSLACIHGATAHHRILQIRVHPQLSSDAILTDSRPWLKYRALGFDCTWQVPVVGLNLNYALESLQFAYGFSSTNLNQLIFRSGASDICIGIDNESTSVPWKESLIEMYPSTHIYGDVSFREYQYIGYSTAGIPFKSSIMYFQPDQASIFRLNPTAGQIESSLTNGVGITIVGGFKIFDYGKHVVFIPYKQRWLWAILNSTVWAIAIGVFYYFIMLVSRCILNKMRQSSRACTGCGYPLIDHSNRCPECGRLYRSSVSFSELRLGAWSESSGVVPSKSAPYAEASDSRDQRDADVQRGQRDRVAGGQFGDEEPGV
jgi:hypothetical protein